MAITPKSTGSAIDSSATIKATQASPAGQAAGATAPSASAARPIPAQAAGGKGILIDGQAKGVEAGGKLAVQGRELRKIEAGRWLGKKEEEEAEVSRASAEEGVVQGETAQVAAQDGYLVLAQAEVGTAGAVTGGEAAAAGTASGSAAAAGAAGATAGTGISAGAIAVGAIAIGAIAVGVANSSDDEVVADTTAPAAPAVALATDSGSSNADRVSSVGTLSLTGIEAGATVQYSINGGTTWTSTFTAAEGTNTVQVRQTDAAGNVSAASTALTFTLDTAAPAPPAVALATDSGSSNADLITNVGSLSLTGIEAGATVQYSIDAGTTWTSTFTAAEGANTVQVRQTDAAGNVSAASTALTFTLDTAAPASHAVALATDSGSSNADLITNVGALSLTGIEAGATVHYSINGGTTWTSTFTAAEGANTVQVRQTDEAGNVSAASTALTFTLDTAAPAAPAVALATDSGSSNADRVSSVGTLSLTGIEAGATVQYSIDAGTTWTSTFTAAEGANTVQVRQTDAAGNVSAASTALTFTLDTAAPAAPAVALATDSGSSNADRISSVGTLSLTGIEAGATVQYSIDAGTTWTSTFTAAEGANTVQVRQTDAAGNVSAASTALTFTLDTAAPAIQSMTAQGSTVTLTYDGALDGINIPGVGNFAITVNEVANTVTNVAVAGNTVTLTLTNAIATGANVIVAYTDPTGGDDAAAIQDAAGNDAAGFSTGVVADGYIRGAQIYIDSNGNGTHEESEKLDGVVTDANGNFILPANAPSGTIIATGGVNIDTGVANVMVLKAPAGSSMINPLTTLVQEIVESDTSSAPAAAKVATATEQVVAALNLTTGTDLTSYDPLAALAANANDVTALAVQKAAVQVATIVTLAVQSAKADASETTTEAAAVSTVISNLATAVTTAAGTSSPVVDLTNNATITTVVTGAVDAANLATVATDAGTATGNIASATTVTEISAEQAKATDTIDPAPPTAIVLTAASDTGASSTDNLTNDTTPTLRVSFGTTANDGTAVVAGDTVTVFSGTTEVGEVTLTATNIANGYVDVTTTALTGDGVHNLTAELKDIAGNESAASASLAVTLDTTATAPTLALATNSGSTSDSITNVGTVNVTGIEAGATWEYSTNSGTDWTSGSGTSFTLIGDGAKSAIVRQTDSAGNHSENSTALAFTLDATIVAPIIGLANNSITNSAALDLSVAADDVIRTYTVDGGTASTTYTPPTTDDTYTVTVTDTDTAGNTANASVTFTLDTAVPTLSSSTPTDNATEVVGSSIVLTFNENVARGTGNIVISDGTNSTEIPVSDTAQVAISGNIVTITPTDAPAPATAYTVTIAAGVITDVAGNAFAGIVGDALTFTMADLPTVTITSNETDNLLNIGDSTTLTFTLSAASNDFTEAAVTVTGGTLTNFSGSGTTYTATLTPTAGSITNATVQVASGVFTSNTLGNLASSTLTIPVDTVAPSTPTLTLATDSGSSTSDSITNVGTVNVTGIEAGATWQYSTNGGTDWTSGSGTSLTLTGEGTKSVIVRQTDASNNLSANSTALAFTLDTTIATPTVVLAVNSGSTSDSITNSAALNVSTAANDVIRTYKIGEGTATSTYTAPTTDGTYTVTVTDTDTAGNTDNASVTFTLDTAAPTLSSSTPVDNATGVSPTANIVLTFSEAVAAGSGNIVISDGSNTITIPVTDVQISGFGTDTITINPTADLALETQYDVTIASGVITDVAGNAFAGVATDALDFTTASAPSLSTTLDGVTNLDPRSHLVLSVTEDVKWAQGEHTITITNLANGGGKDGFRAESTANTQTITVTADANGNVTSITGGTMTIDNANNQIVIDPTFDLDISNNYSLAVSTGAFQGLESGQASVAFTPVSFSTVTPGLLSAGSGAAALSQSMNATTGTIQTSLRWLDVTNPADDEPSSAVYQEFDAGSLDFAFVVKDMDSDPNDITVTDTYIQFNNFGANDLIYIDNQLNQANVQQWVVENVFSGGVGTAGDPFSVTMNGTTLASSFNVVVDSAVTLPTFADALVQLINSNNWSNTGIMITG